MKSSIPILLLGSALLLGSLRASAHHSYAMFDGANPREATATVARVEWRNPHVLLWLYETREGKPTLVVLESDSVPALLAMGWTRNALRPQERIQVHYLPHRDGRPAGHLDYLIKQDGRRLEGVRGIVGSIRESARGERAP
jgi:hypothetical protein